MLDMPDVPNWLQWLATLSALVVIVWAVLKYLWGRWLSDTWAKRSREAARTKAVTLVQQYREALHLADNDRRFQAISTVILSDLIIGIIMMVVGGSVLLTTGIELISMPENITDISFLIGFGIFIIAWNIFSGAVNMRQRYIKPYVNWIKYHETTLSRISSLLADAGLNDEEQGAFIDRVVDNVESQISFDEEIIEPQE